MSEYKIAYRKIKVIGNWHKKQIEKINPNFCTYEPYWINYTLGREYGIFMSDGTHIIPIPQSSFTGLIFSKEVKPTEDVVNLVHKELFNV